MNRLAPKGVWRRVMFMKWTPATKRIETYLSCGHIQVSRMDTDVGSELWETVKIGSEIECYACDWIGKQL